MRVLVVEDEARLAAYLRRGLEAERYAVDVAGDGETGLWMASSQPYDAIVLDIMLPRLNGYRVCAELRRRGVWSPVLMLTAKDGELDEAEALDTGADDFLSKPFSYVVRSPTCGPCCDAEAGSDRPCSRPATCVSIPPPTGSGGATPP